MLRYYHYTLKNQFEKLTISVGNGSKAQSLFYLTLPEFYAIKLSKKQFEDLCSKLTPIDVFGHMSRFQTVSNCISPCAVVHILLFNSSLEFHHVFKLTVTTIKINQKVLKLSLIFVHDKAVLSV